MWPSDTVAAIVMMVAKVKTPIESSTYVYVEDIGENYQIVRKLWKGESQIKKPKFWE